MPVCKFCFQALKSIVFIDSHHLGIPIVCFLPFPQIAGPHEMALTWTAFPSVVLNDGTYFS